MTRSKNADSRRGTLASAARAASIELYDEELEAAVRAEIGEEYDDYALIADYLAGDLSPADRERVEERIRTDRKFRALAEPLKMVWNRSVPPDREVDLADRVEAERDWQRLKKRIELEEQGMHTPTLEERRAKWRRARRTVLGVSAAAILGGFAAWLRPQLIPVPSLYMHTDAPRYGQLSAKLPDETQVTLLPESHLSHLRSFSTTDEHKFNLNGEGTFTVTRAAGRPVVIAGAGVEVTATEARFTVQAYDAVPIAYVQVHEGRVQVRARTVYASGHPITLRAGQGARVGPELQIERADPPIAPVGEQGTDDGGRRTGNSELGTGSAAPTTTTKRAVSQAAAVVRWPREHESVARALTDSIARDFGERPRSVTFIAPDTLEVLFWSPGFWRDYLESKEFPMRTAPIAETAAKHVAGFVWTTYARDNRINVIRVSFWRVRIKHLAGFSKEVPADEAWALFMRTYFETGQPQPLLAIAQR